MPTISPDPYQSQAPQWMQRIQQGDVAAFECLFRAYAPGLCAFVGRYVRSAAVAEDLIQDLFLTLWQKRAEIRIVGSVDTYLFGAAKHRALNHLRHERVEDRFCASLLEERDARTVTGESEILDLLEVQEAIESLPARCRLIFTLNRRQGLTYAEIAESLGLSVKTIETQMGRALKALRNWTTAHSA